MVTEYVSAGRIGSPAPRPATAVPDGAEDGSSARVTGAAAVPDWYWDRYPDFVDVSFTVPAARYESTLDRVRVLGTVVHLQQNITDVTTAVADLEARIGAAKASVLRVQALLAKAATIEQVLLIEKELTARQSNLESLQAQQRALAGQVAESTLTVRLVPVRRRGRIRSRRAVVVVEAGRGLRQVVAGARPRRRRHQPAVAAGWPARPRGMVGVAPAPCSRHVEHRGPGRCLTGGVDTPRWWPAGTGHPLGWALAAVMLLSGGLGGVVANLLWGKGSALLGAVAGLVLGSIAGRCRCASRSA